jgi:voltage-gated potassium channel
MSLRRKTFARLNIFFAMKNILPNPVESFRRLRERPLVVLEKIVSRRNAVMLLRLFGIFILVLGIYSFVFHLLMLHEGKSYHWFVGVYWTIATMTTVGYGDIVFQSIPGMIFSVIVIVSGIFFILVIIPFTLIQLFQSAARVPREAPKGMTDHIILTHYGPVTSVLIQKLSYYSTPYILLASKISDATEFRDRGIRVVLGEPDDPETYKQIAIDKAVLIATTDNDIANTSNIHAARQISSTVEILATSTEQESNEILRAAGANEILTLDEMMGQSLARRTIAGDAIAHIIGTFGTLTIAEAAAVATPLVNKKLRETKLRELAGVVIIGILEGPNFYLPNAELEITNKSILILAGTQEQIAMYNELFCIYNSSNDPVIVIGAGNVGRWVTKSLDEHGLEYRVLEKNPEKALNVPHVSVLDAARVENLQKVGFFKAPAVIISTHNDDQNIYLATLFRNLRKDIQIVSRATLERNVNLLHRAGCDIVLSYASFGSNFIINHLKRGTYLMLSEGVDVFQVKTPESIVGKTIGEVQLRETAGVHVVGICCGETTELISDSEHRIPKNSEIILIASDESESLFLKKYGREI